MGTLYLVPAVRRKGEVMPARKPQERMSEELTVRRKRRRATTNEESHIQGSVTPEQLAEIKAYMASLGGLVQKDFISWAVLDAVRHRRRPPLADD
jgi:hypothetical protein